MATMSAMLIATWGAAAVAVAWLVQVQLRILAPSAAALAYQYNEINGY